MKVDRILEEIKKKELLEEAIRSIVSRLYEFKVGLRCQRGELQRTVFEELGCSRYHPKMSHVVKETVQAMGGVPILMDGVPHWGGLGRRGEEPVVYQAPRNVELYRRMVEGMTTGPEVEATSNVSGATQVTEKPIATIRGLVDDDVDYIYGTWLNCYRVESALTKGIPKDLYFKRHHRVVEDILARPEVSVGVVVLGPDAEADDPIAAYAVVELNPTTRPVIHFMYTKLDWRGLGFARDLLAHFKVDPNRCVYSHKTFLAQQILRKYPGSAFDPYATVHPPMLEPKR